MWVIRPPVELIMFAIWVDTWLSRTPVAVRKMRNPGRQREADANQGPLSNQERLWNGWPLFHFITCDCTIDILHLTCCFNGWNSLPLSAAVVAYINRVFVIIVLKKTTGKQKIKMSFSRFRASLNGLNHHWENIQIKQSTFQVIPLWPHPTMAKQIA